MAIGGYRFRRSFGNVASRFRGARFDTYPLTPYPTEGLVLDLAAFTYTDSGVQDKSGEDNEAVLYSGRGVNLAGADYVELPDVGATKSITVLVRSSTDTTLYATDDAAQTEDASVALVADGTWQEVTLTFTNAISGKIRLGSDGTSFFSGDLADARCKDASGNLLDQFYLNEHTDVAAAGLDGLPVIGRNGNIGQYVNCAAVVQEGFDSALAGLGAYGDKLWLDDISKNVSIPPTSIPDGATLTTKFYPNVSFCWLYDLQENNAAIYANSGSYSLRIRSGGINYSFGDGSEIVIGGFNVAEISRSGNTYSVTLNGTSLGSQVIPTEFYITHISAGAGTFPFKGLIDFISGSITWDGTEADAIANGWTVKGSPNTVAELRTTPPQVLGMDFNRYSSVTPTPVLDPDGGILIPESLTKGIDALGNNIEELRSSTTFNADESGYALTPDDDSLDLTTEATWVFRGNFYGTISSNETVLAKTNITNGTRSWQFLKDVTDQNDELSLILGSNTGKFGIAYRLRGLADAEATIAIVYDSSGATALDKLKVYVDGSPATVVVNNGTAPSSLFVSTSDITICARPNAGVYGNYQNTPVSDVKIYNRALTVDEIAKFS